jgi:RNA polymerase sigma-70 factor (ECF subfamily)
VTNQPTTRPSLLLRVRDPMDQGAWREFVELYGPLIYRFAVKRGLQDADASDLTQIVFEAVGGEIRRLDYDRRQGLFRGWLFGVVRNQLHNLMRREGRSPRGTGDTSVQDLLERQPERATDEALWEVEYERRMFLWAAERVRGSFQNSSWQAFWETAVEGKSAQDAATALGLTIGAVYTAKSRVLDAIKREIEQLQGENEGSSFDAP